VAQLVKTQQTQVREHERIEPELVNWVKCGRFLR